MDYAKDAEETLKQAISSGSTTDYLSGYREYEKAILYFEGVGKKKESHLLLSRLEKILQVVIERGNLEAPYFDKLGPFFILYAYHFKAKILETLNEDLSDAVKSRVGALEMAQGIDWIEQIINIIVDLLLEGLDDYCLRYLKYAKDKKEELIEELIEQIQKFQSESSGFFFKRKGNPEDIALQIYNAFLKLLGLMVERYNSETSFLTEGLELLRVLKKYAHEDFEYLDSRLMALEALIRGFSNENVDSYTISHVKSKIIPHTLIESPYLDRLEDLLTKYVNKMKLNIPVAVGEVPILGANPAGSPHLSIVGQTGVGKTTLVKQIIKENKRVQDTTVFIFDHHLEYADIADQIIQIGGEQKPEVTSYYPVYEIGDTFTTAQEHIRTQQTVFSQEGASPDDLAQKLQAIEEQTRPTISRFVVDTIESLLDKEEDVILPTSSAETIVFWPTYDEPWIVTTIVSTILKRILNMAIQEKISDRILIVAEEAQNLANDKWIRNLASEGRKFGLFLMAISQAPEFDPWVVSNSEILVFRLRKSFTTNSDLDTLFTDQIKKFIPNLDIGEYLSYHRELRSWVFSYNPESLSPIHAEKTVEMKILQLQQLLSS